MIKFKQSFGNDIKCKIEGEYMVSVYEMNLLAAHPIKGLFQIQADKSGTISFQGGAGKSVSQCLTQGINQQQLILIISNIVRIYMEMKALGMGTARLVLNPDWIFVNEESNEVFIMYLPVNGVAIQYDIVLFLKDMIHASKLEGREREGWRNWLNYIEKKGINARSLKIVHAFRMRRKTDRDLIWNFNHGMERDNDDAWGMGGTGGGNGGNPWNGTGRKTGIDDDDGEAPTDMVDDEDTTGDEAPTGMGGGCGRTAWMDEDEAPTGMGGGCGGTAWMDEAPTGMDGDEAPTGMENGEKYTTRINDDEDTTDDEAPTGMVDDDEMPTGMEDGFSAGKSDGYMWNGTDKMDGTAIESTSESGYYESADLPVIIRRSTGERASVNKPEFRIGRSPQKADFCIVGNSSVSNVHAIIKKKGKNYYLSDNCSTNGTYVDGRKIEANDKPTRLTDGCVIRIWNEELEFRL